MQKKTFPAIAKSLLAAILYFFADQMAHSETRAVAVTADEDGTPFVLDNTGSVWAFLRPDELLQPVKLPDLSNVKQIAPFAALTNDGHVFVWDFVNQPNSSLNPVSSPSPDGTTDQAGDPAEGPEARIVTYEKPHEVRGLNNVVSIYGMSHHFLALLKDGHVVEFGQKFSGISMVPQGAGPGKVLIPEVQSVELAKPELVSSVSHVISAAVSKTSETVMSNDGFAYTWGQEALDKNFKINLNVFYSPSSPLRTYIGQDQMAIAVNLNYLVALSKGNRLRYWGYCDNGWRDYGGVLTGTADKLREVRKLVVEPNAWPNVALLTNGHVAFSLPPGVSWKSGTCEKDSSSEIPTQPRLVSGLSVDIVDIAYPLSDLVGSTHSALMVASDGSLWVVDISDDGEVGIIAGKQTGAQRINLP